MNTDRFVIKDEVWDRIAPHLPGKVSDCGVTAKYNRLFMESVLWRVRTGSPWRDLPVFFGNGDDLRDSVADGCGGGDALGDAFFQDIQSGGGGG